MPVTAAPFVFDRFLRFDELTELLQAVADQHPDLVSLVEIGRSVEGRQQWLCEVTNRATGSGASKPALWVDASIHATELTACVAALHLLHRLITGHGVDGTVTRLLDTRTVYIVPRVNPDGAEVSLADSPRLLRSSVRPWPWDEYLAPGLHPGDLDGDGRILQMRVADPHGAWRSHPDEPRVMVLRGPADPPGDGCYRLLMEGSFEHFDSVLLDMARDREGLDLNRNFPAGWRPEGEQVGAGPFPGSEPEVRSLMQAIVARPNIGAYAALHTWGGFLFRPSSMRPDDQMPRDDVRLLTTVGNWLTDINDYPVYSVFHESTPNPKDVMSGAADDWAYDHLGLVAYTPEIWDIGVAAGIGHTHPLRWVENHPVTDDLALVRYNDEQLGGRYCMPWTPFEHPQLGPVELGGWDFLNGWSNAPAEVREREVSALTEWFVLLASATPRLEVHTVQVEPIGDGVWRVRVVVQNTGWLPTNITTNAVEHRLVQPVVADIELGPDVRLVHGHSRIELGQLAGRWLRESDGPLSFDGSRDRAKAEWVVRAVPGVEVHVRIAHQRAGRVDVVVTLGG